MSTIAPPPRSGHFWAVRGLLALVGLAGLGCTTQQVVCSPVDHSGCVIDEVRVVGNRAVPDDEILSRIATGPTGGSFEGVPLVGVIDALTVQYERFDRFVLERDLERVARIYRAKGYYNAVVRAGRVRRIDAHPAGSTEVKNARLLVEIVVEEGPPVVVGGARITFPGGMPKEPRAVLAATKAKHDLQKGDVFSEERYERARLQIQRALTDLGYAYAKVEPSATVDLVNNVAVVELAVSIGPLCTFGKVELIGLEQRVPDWQVRPMLGIVEDEEYSTKKIEAAEVALSELGVFGAISIEPVLDDQQVPLPTKVPVRVVLQPANLASVRLGAGVELGDQVAVRGIAGWQHRSATRTLDRFAIDGRARGIAHPWRISTIGTGRVEFVPELSVRVQYSLPFPGDPRATLFIQTQGSYGLERNHDPPRVLDEAADVPVEVLLENRQGYQRTFFLSRLLLSLSHNLSFSYPFSLYFSESSASSLLISYLDLFAQLDLRENDDNRYDRVRPTKGVLLSADLQVAGFGIGGDARDVKIQPELRWYASLAKGFVLAGRVGVGLLYTDNYGFTLDEIVPARDVLAEGGDPTRRTEVNRDVGLMTKRGLFSGGPSSNRGYGFNEIAPHRVVDDEGLRLADPDAIGGRTRWETSLELRFPIRGSWTGVSFIDASDVSPGFAEFRFDHPHVSTGAGVRYDSPIGPIRLDLGVRVPYLQVIGEPEVESCTNDTTGAEWACKALVLDEGKPADSFGLPMALSIAIGNAF